MNIPRLKHLIEVLEKVEPVRFDLEYWAETYCGTTACAVGWAALDPEFMEQGLRLRTDSGHAVKRLSARITSYLSPWLNQQWGFEAVKAFFGIDDKQSNTLFYIWSYPASQRNDPTAVIARIRELIGEAA